MVKEPEEFKYKFKLNITYRIVLKFKKKLKEKNIVDNTGGGRE